MKLKALTDIKVKGHAKVAKGERFEMTGPAAKYLVADGHAEVVEASAVETGTAGPLDAPTGPAFKGPAKKANR
jgi:hypothetical protein